MITQTLPCINDVYDLGRGFQTVVITQCDANHVRFTWFLNGEKQHTIMPVDKFWKMDPVKKGTL